MQFPEPLKSKKKHNDLYIPKEAHSNLDVILNVGDAF